jgi:hypothetical protein
MCEKKGILNKKEMTISHISSILLLTRKEIIISHNVRGEPYYGSS